MLMCIILPNDQEVEEDGRPAAKEQAPAAPRFSTLLEDEGANVLECDDAFTQMFGYTA